MRKVVATRRPRPALAQSASRQAQYTALRAGRAAATAFGLAFLLAACQTPTVVRDRIVEVKTPVAVQPVRPDQVPAVPAPLGPRPRSLSAATDTLLAKVCEFVGYALKADPLLRVSSGQPQKELPRYAECER